VVPELAERLAPGNLVAPAERDAGPVLGEELDDRPSDPPRATGDDRDLAGERATRAIQRDARLGCRLLE
jgi:hypothetical protein